MTAPGSLKLPQAFAAYFSSRAPSTPAVAVKQQPPDDDDVVLLDKENVNPGAFKKKEREGKDKLIKALLEQLEAERAAHTDLKRGLEALGEQLASVDKLVYTMDDELTAVYDLLASSKVVRNWD